MKYGNLIFDSLPFRKSPIRKRTHFRKSIISKKFKITKKIIQIIKS